MPMEQSVRFAMPLSGPVGEVMPAAGAEFIAVHERNIPDHLTALEAGVPVFASDRHASGGRRDHSARPLRVAILDRHEEPMVGCRRAAPIVRRS